LINKVIVVFKTHLDIGFTDLAESVLKKYRELFIPQAVDLALKVNIGGKKRFVWTVGSYLIAYYLSSSDVSKENKEKLENLLRLGWVRWHGLAFTTHTELMDETLLKFNLSISKDLDARYGQKTIAAKMTDVPGHSIGILPFLEEAGIEYLHVGVNDASLMPEIPRLFVWRYNSTDIIVNYAGSYGESSVAPSVVNDKDQVCLEFAHAGDNAGPPSLEYLDTLYGALAEKYPGAEIEAGSLDEFAMALRGCRDKLPVVNEEIGDTWIHGVSSDPLKTAQYKTLLHLKENWLAQGKLSGAVHKNFMENMLMVTEHTWGSDSKCYLQDYSNWKKDDFKKARAADSINEENLSSFNRVVLSLYDAKTVVLRNTGNASYKKFEESHAEQRTYIEKAVTALPEELASEARNCLRKRSEGFPGGAEAAMKGRVEEINTPIVINGWTVIVGPKGEIRYLKNPALGFERELSFCEFKYEIFNGKAADDNLYYYCRDMKKYWFWFNADFAKLGLSFEEGIKAGLYSADTCLLSTDSNYLRIVLKMPPFTAEEYGCPREIVIEHCFEENSIKTTLYLSGKDANRIPEALWLGMNLNVPNSNLWQMKKIGRPVSPLRIVRGGNRRLHCVEELIYSDAETSISVIPEHSPLACLGEPCLYNTNDDFGNLNQGINFLLYNNRWGTNFKQWFEDDVSLSFKTTINRP